jgi:hypothetical protein
MSNSLYNHGGTSSILNNTLTNLFNNTPNNDISTLIQSMDAYHQNIEMYNRNISDLLNIIRIINIPSQVNNIPTPNVTTYNTIGRGIRNVRNRERQVPNSNNIPRPLSPTEIEQHISTITYEEGMNDTVCPISLDDFVVGESICKINVCGHIFKRNQLLHWVCSRNQCPVCRAFIVAPEHTDNVDLSGNNYDMSGNTALSTLTFNEILSLLNLSTHPFDYILDIPIYYDVSRNIA